MFSRYVALWRRGKRGLGRYGVRGVARFVVQTVAESFRRRCGGPQAPKEDELDLMSVFQSEDAEDSSTSDLAANLFDVDVQNIEKLGSEVSEFLGGMRSK